MATKQDNAITLANALLDACAGLLASYNTANDIVNKYNKQTYGTLWDNFKTAALNADGSLGAADASPVLTNPIDTRVAAQSALRRAVLSSDLKNGITLFQRLQDFFGNQAVAAADRLAVLEALAG